MNRVKPELMILAVRMIVGSETRTLLIHRLGFVYQPAGRQGVYNYVVIATGPNSPVQNIIMWVKKRQARCSGSSAQVLYSFYSHVCNSLLNDN